MSYNIKRKILDNIAAIRLAKVRIDGSHCPLDEDRQLEVLRGFSGFGGIKGILNQWGATNNKWAEDGASKQDLELYSDYQNLFDAIRDLFPFSEHKRVMESVKNSTLTSFYTPRVVCSTFYEVLSKYMTPDSFYDPSTGSGVFIEELLKVFPGTIVRGYEKEMVTAKIVETIYKKEAAISNAAFEESNDSENGRYSLLATNPPYGDISIYDEKYSKDKTLNDFCKRIHNYFVAKSVAKIQDGGIGAWLISDAFLNTVSNKSIRKHLFDKCDFISLTVMPDNLMMDTGGTMAHSHFLVVQKNTSKTCLSPEEELLVESEFRDFGPVKIACNKWLSAGTQWVMNRIGIPVAGKNQYGKPSTETKWDKTIEEISTPFRAILERDFAQRFKGDKPEKSYEERFNSLPPDVQDIVARCPGLMATNRRSYDLMNEKIIDTVIDIAIEKSGLSDIFKTREEWEKELETSPVVGDYTNSDTIVPNEIPPKLEEVLPNYVQFKNGILVECERDV